MKTFRFSNFPLYPEAEPRGILLIKKTNIDTIVILEESGTGALEYLKSMIDKKKIVPALIFLDINMPGMSGWEFL